MPFIGYSLTSNTNGTDASSIVAPVPAAVRNGDVMVAFILQSTTELSTPASGWTQIGAEQDSTGAGIGTWCYYRVASSEPSSYTWGFGAAKAASVAVVAFRNIDNGTVLNNDAHADAGTTTTATGPNVTTTSRISQIIHYNAARNSTATLITHSASGVTKLLDGGSTGSTTYNRTHAVFDGGWKAAGTITGLAVTLSATPTDSVSWTVGINAIGAAVLGNMNQAVNRSATS